MGFGRVRVMTEQPTEGEDRLNVRSAGVQNRSRERIEQILAAAEPLVAETGLEGLKMRELARRAGLPIASLYHYFPSSSSIVRAIAIRYLDSLRAVLSAELADIIDHTTPILQRPQTADRLVRNLVDYLLRSPASAVIWDSLRSSPELRQLDMEDTAENARALEPYLRWVAPDLPEDRVSMLMLVILEAVQANVIVMMHSPQDMQSSQIDALADMLVATLKGLQGLKA
jgi:AcrR family transcriptional regulator